MAFTIIIGLLFLAIVFFHYLQGFFSSAISAILAVVSAVLAFSWHETIVESLLQGKAANLAHAMVLVVLFAAIYIILRTIFDKLVPEGVSIPAAIDKVGGALMGCIAAAFALGILAIAAQELPLGAGIVGYTKYDTSDASIQLQVGTGQSQTGYNFNELKSNAAGRFDEENGRMQLFPIFPLGVDEIVVKTVNHLSGIGSMQGSQKLTDVHPDFLQELYGQRAGLQSGANVVAANLATQSELAVAINGIYSVTKVRLVDSEYSQVRHGVVTTPLKLDPPAEIPGDKHTTPEKVQYAAATIDKDNNKDMALIVVRISFGLPAADSEDRMIRLSPGAIRLVANRPNKDGELNTYNYYPIGTLEPGTPHPMLYLDKPDDPIFVSSEATGATRAGIDAVFAVDKAGILNEVTGKKPTIAQGTFIEVKRMFREELGGKPVEPWTAKAPGLAMGSLHQIKWRADVVGSVATSDHESNTPAGPPPTDTPAITSAINGIHEKLALFAQKVGLSEGQKASLATLEGIAAARIRENPKEAENREALEDTALTKFRDLLTPPQKATFDAEREKATAATADATTAAHLKVIWTVIDAYEKKNAGKLPPDFGSMVGPNVTPATFLQGDTTTAVPPELATQDLKHQADWVNEHTDFVYKGKDRTSKLAKGLFVLAYTKHATADNTSFLRADGVISQLNAADTTKAIAELDTGQNPPPTLEDKFPAK